MRLGSRAGVGPATPARSRVADYPRVGVRTGPRQVERSRHPVYSGARRTDSRRSGAPAFRASRRGGNRDAHGGRFTEWVEWSAAAVCGARRTIELTNAVEMKATGHGVYPQMARSQRGGWVEFANAHPAVNRYP